MIWSKGVKGSFFLGRKRGGLERRDDGDVSGDG